MSKKKPSAAPWATALLIHLLNHSPFSDTSSSMEVKTDGTMARVMIDAFALGVGSRTPTPPSKVAAGNDDVLRIGGGAAVQRVAPCPPARCHKATWTTPMRLQCNGLSDHKEHQKCHVHPDPQADTTRDTNPGSVAGAPRHAPAAVTMQRSPFRVSDVVRIRARWERGLITGLPSPAVHRAIAPALQVTSP